MIQIGGLEKVSLLDYPGKISTIIFTYGCNLRCEYCHNPELVVKELNKELLINTDEIIGYLRRRKGKIDAVVITGGEPLIYDDIAFLIRKIRDLGLLVKLDTNGFFPEKLQRLIDLHLLDYIAMDIKYSDKEYLKRTTDKNSLDKVIKSIKIIMNSGVDYEFRTTYVKGIHKIKDSESIAKLIRDSKKYYIQNFRPGKTLNPTLSVSNSFNDNELNKILLGARKFVKNSQVR